MSRELCLPLQAGGATGRRPEEILDEEDAYRGDCMNWTIGL